MRRSRHKTRGWLLASWLALPLAAGCSGEPEIDTEYGRSNPSRSVNGTAVLAEMFEDAGHRVITWRRLSPKLREADTIVWIPDNMSPPSLPVRNWFENWLSRPGHRLIYVGRDYDAAPQFWKSIQPGDTAARQKEYERRADAAQQYFDHRRRDLPAGEDASWFTVSKSSNRRQVTTLAGPWSDGIDAAKTEIVLHGKLEPADVADTLLRSDEDVLVSAQDFGRGSELIVVNNSSFLLNMPLVNHEHRKLAGKLINRIGPDQKVVFLESRYGDPPIVDEEPEPKAPTGVELFSENAYPLNMVLLQVALVGLVLILSRWPIFGLPRDLPGPPQSDFGLHIEAVGRLLRKTRNRGYANQRVGRYHQVAADRQPASSQAPANPPDTATSNPSNRAHE